MSGNITGDIKTGTYGTDGKWCSFSIATNLGFGDNKKTIYMNCGAFGKNADNIAKYFAKGDEIIIADGVLSQKKHEEKTYTSIVINQWEFGKMKERESKGGGKGGGYEEGLFDDDDPFSDEQIPF
jgi:single-strand DNA-binding protein